MGAPRLVSRTVIAVSLAAAVAAMVTAGCDGCSKRPRVGLRKDGGPPAVAVIVDEPSAPPKPAAAGRPDAAVPLFAEQEPNDDISHAEVIQPPQSVRGAVGFGAGDGGAARSDVDLFRWTVVGEVPKLAVRVELAGASAAAMLVLEVLDGDGAPLAQADVAEGAEVRLLVVPNLVVEVGRTYLFRVRERPRARALPAVTTATGPAAYTLTIRTAALQPGDEEEPNDNIARANLLAAGVEESGYFGRVHDEDWLRLPAGVPDAGTLRIEVAIPEGVAASLRLREVGGATLAEAKVVKGEEIRIRNAPVAPGGVIALRAENGKNLDEKWSLRLVVEPPLVGAEVEPNGTPATAMVLETSAGSGQPAQQIAGFLWAGDVDVYRLHCASVGTLHVEVAPPPGLDVRLERVGETGAVMEKVDAAGAGKSERLDGIRCAGRDLLVRVAARPRDVAFDAPYVLGWSFAEGSADGADGGGSPAR